MNKETWLFAYSIARAAENLTKLRYPLEYKESVDFAKKVVKGNEKFKKYKLPILLAGGERFVGKMLDLGFIWRNDKWIKRE